MNELNKDQTAEAAHRDDNRDDYQEAYIKACELDSPNSPDFDALVQRIFDEMRS